MSGTRSVPASPQPHIPRPSKSHWSFSKGAIMKRVKNLSRAGWMVVGIVVTLILVPTGVALALTYNGIEGTNGITATLNPAYVTSAGQLEATEAAPAKYVDDFANL